VLPGADRMYPDTDTPPFAIPETRVPELRSRLASEATPDRVSRYLALGLSPRAAEILADAPWATLFDAVVPVAGEHAARLADALARRIPHRWRRSGDRSLPGASRLRTLVAAVGSGSLRPAALVPALDAILDEPDVPVEEIVGRFLPRPDDDARIEEELAAALTRAAAGRLASASHEARVRFVMGEVMRPLRGRVDGRAVHARVQAGLTAEP